MKAMLRGLTVTLVGVLLLTSCVKGKDDAMREDGMKAFSTPEEAANKAKEDLIRVLQADKTLNLGVEGARLQQASVGPLVRHVELDFARLVGSDSAAGLSDLVGGDRGMIAPFLAGGAVVGVAEVAKRGEGWVTASLANKSLMDELQAVRQAAGDSALTAYDVPNLNLTIYAAGERYYLKFAKFSLREGVPFAAFHTQLRDSARQFERAFGEELRKGKLVR